MMLGKRIIDVGRVREVAKDLVWSIYGFSIKPHEIKDVPKKIMFVCRGNICRSTFAEFYLRKKLEAKKNYSYHIDSCGIFANNGNRSTETAVKAAKLFGVNLESHKSKKIDRKSINTFNAVFVMEHWQKLSLEKEYELPARKVILLAQYDLDGNKKPTGWERYNIVDPYGKGMDVYQGCYTRIKNAIDQYIGKLENLNLH